MTENKITNVSHKNFEISSVEILPAIKKGQEIEVFNGGNDLILSSNIQELEINEDLKKCGVTRFAKEYSASILIVCKQKPIIFKIQKEHSLLPFRISRITAEVN